MLIRLEQWMRQREKVDIVLFDERGSKWLSRCVPIDAPTLLLPREPPFTIIYKTLFVFSFLKWLLSGRYGKGGIRTRLLASYVIALIRTIKPKIVLSNNDGSEIMRAIHVNCKDVFVAVIQLALRERIKHPKVPIMPVYYSFGQAEEKLFLASGLICNDVRPVGSLRNSIYLGEIRRRSLEDQNGPAIVFVSQWKRGLCLNPETSLFQQWNIGHRKTFQVAYRYAKTQSVKLGVVLRNTHDHKDNMLEQEKYFVEAAGSQEVLFLRGSDDVLDSYRHVYSAKVVVHFFSTLGYEIFGCGKRVLCCIGLGGGQRFIEEFGVQELVEKLPGDVVLLDDLESHVPKMISHLFEMTDEEYDQSTESAREYYMSYNHQKQTYIKIRNDIEEILAASNGLVESN